MSVVAELSGRQRHVRRIFVFRVERKFQDIAGYLRLGNNKSALADALGIKHSTMVDAARFQGCTPQLHEKLEKGLRARGYRFSPDWPEWIDPQAHERTPDGDRKDTPERFIARFAAENAPTDESEEPQTSAAAIPIPPSPLVSAAGHDPGAMERFVEDLDVRDIKTIRVFATTGTATVRSLRQSLDSLAATDPAAPLDVQILLSSAYISDGGRAAGIDQTRIELARFANDRPNLAINVRTYASVATFRGVMVEHRDGTHSARLGYYYWGEHQGGRSRADSHNTPLARVSAEHPLLRVYLSWFRHLWGSHRVNTLIFDFDDTLFATTDSQVGGWMHAAEMAAREGIATLTPKVIKDRRVNHSAILKVFLEKQSEEAIFREIFGGALSVAAKEAIRASRVAERERRSERDAKPIRPVLNDIDDLRAEYRVIIASATSEQLIRRVLAKHRIRPFSYLFGRSARQPGWRDIETKAQLFVRLSSMLGIPLDRMIFIGDSDADYRAAVQLGMSFIENTYNADEHGCGTLIKKPQGRHYRISGQQPGELKACIAQIERELQDRWDRI